MMVLRLRSAVFALLVVGLATVHAFAQAPAAVSPESGRHFVWRVAKDGRAIAWLVGSVHVLSADAYPLPPVFGKAFDATVTLMTEVNLGAAADPAVILPAAATAVLGNGRTLSALLDRETYERVQGSAMASGLPMLLLDRMPPWLVAMTLAVPALRRAGFDPALGLDQHFYERATAAKRPIRGLETLAYQLDRLSGLPLSLQVDMLRAVLSDVDLQVSAVTDLVEAWRTGDVAALERLLLKEFRQSPEVYQRLLIERNQAWAPKIAACASEPRPCLVVVGGAHLVGPDSVVALLRQAGFSVDQQ
jgi:uncharacterized protein YbaP (TraB family)